MKNRGFTLIEMVIYIALFSILIGGLLVSMFYIIQNVRTTGDKVVSESELSFVVKKIDWVLTGATDIEVPTIDRLEVTKSGVDFSIEINADGVIELCEDGSCSPITTENAVVDELTFTVTPGTPEGVEVKIIIDGNTANFSKYSRI